MIRRRALLGAAATVGLTLRSPAQPSSQPPLVGWLGLASAQGDRSVLAAFRQGLVEAGREEGRTIRVVSRHADGRIEQLPALIAELEALNVALFIAGGRAVARALVRSTGRAIVAARLPASDPALFASLARPGGSLTGFSSFAEELSAKRIEILKEVMPNLTAIGIMHAADPPNAFDFGGEAEAAARAHGLRAVRLRLEAPSSGEAAALIRSLRPAGIRALVVVQDFVTITLRDDISRLALAEGLVTVTDEREFVESGSLMSFGADVPDLFRRAATYVDRILNGANPAELPIQLATKFEFVINLKTAKTLRLAIPASVLARADEVIE